MSNQETEVRGLNSSLRNEQTSPNPDMASPMVYPTSPLPRLFASPRTSTPRITGGFPIPSFHSRPSPRRPSPIPSFDFVIPEQGRQEPSPPF
ncbi:hypothetical protein FRC03_006766, partial [Tulasnella sp. 419]